jgi:hypothetical protein
MTDDFEVARYALRTFKTYDGLLRPIAMNGHYWMDGVCKAECLSTTNWDNHTAPDENCSCGVYGSLSVEHLVAQFPRESALLITVIAAEGQTIIGPRGLRCEYARIVGYWSPWRGIRRICKRNIPDGIRFKRLQKMLDEYHLPFQIEVPPEKRDERYWA